jgi:hypothetical protein
MINILFLILTMAAIGTGVWYMWFYESSIPGATYQDTYVLISLAAAIIFGGLFLAGRVNREQSQANVLQVE